VFPAVDPDQPNPVFPKVVQAFQTNQPRFGFTKQERFVRAAAIPLRRDDAVLSVYKPIDQIPRP